MQLGERAPDPWPGSVPLGKLAGQRPRPGAARQCDVIRRFWDDVPFFIGSVDRETRFIILEVDEKGAGGRVRIWWDDGSEDFAMRWGS